jgi:hypothetical protein
MQQLWYNNAMIVFDAGTFNNDVSLPVAAAIAGMSSATFVRTFIDSGLLPPRQDHFHAIVNLRQLEGALHRPIAVAEIDAAFRKLQQHRLYQREWAQRKRSNH